MDLRNALKSIIKPHEKDTLAPLTTSWGEQLDPGNVLKEYPRPQMRRDSYLSLNGYWDYAFTRDTGFPEHYSGKILVPFSPESALSGVGRQLKPEEFLWYRRILPKTELEGKSGNFSDMRLLIHFGAVDYQADVYINRHHVTTHLGGYLPFNADITDFLLKTDNELVLRVQDATDQKGQARGKQTLTRGGIFYTAQSGIWQSVWLEWVPASHMKSLWFETDFDTRKVTAHISATLCGEFPALSLSVSAKGKEIIQQTLSLSAENPRALDACLSFTLPEDAFYPWSPENPFLYDADISLGTDHIQSYFAMRLYSIEKPADSPKGVPVFCLNHKPFFLMGVLDQGYWPDGLYTAPSDEALLYDIATMKSLGFNMLRKHIKVECARWYYHCDRLGMIVCQDMVNGGSRYHMPVISYLPTLFPTVRLKDTHAAMLSRKDLKAREQWEKECVETVETLKFFPSIAIWCPFNEGWGQFDTSRITDVIRSADPSRLIDSASGWFDQNCGDFVSVHNYFRPLSHIVEKWGTHSCGRALFLSEYGGFACHLAGHSSVERVFGYKRYDTLPEFQKAYQELTKKSLPPLKAQGLSGAVYTQLSDVEEEVNGLLTYDRKVNKLTG